jgi:CubicO group peptidase (beta-lactamase class C family)
MSEEEFPAQRSISFMQTVVHAQGYGMADLEQRVPVDVERTVWPIASVTKLFTGVAAMQLVGSGDIALDQDINRSLRQVTVPPQGYPPITLAHLLAHTGGLDELPGRQFDPDRLAPPWQASRPAGAIGRPVRTRRTRVTALR